MGDRPAKHTPRTVCMFSNLYPPVSSGSSTQCAQLSRELARAGWKVVVITAKPDRQAPEHEQDGGVSVYRVPAVRLPRLPVALNTPWLFLTLSWANYRRIRAILDAHPPDVLHAHNHMFDLALFAALFARRLGKPLVLTVHTIIRHPAPWYDALLRLADQVLLKHLVVRRADRLICPDSLIQAYTREAFGEVRTSLVPYGIGPLPEADPRQARALRQALGLGPGPVILSLGHLHATRNRRELVESLPELRKRFPDLKVLIVGDVGLPSIRDLAARLNVEGALILAGAVPHASLPEYLALADVEATWFDRRHPHQALGIAAREAMAAGIAILTAADLDAFGSGVLRDGENVVSVDLQDRPDMLRRFIDLLENQELRNAIGARARETVRAHFAWRQVGERTAAVYMDLVRRETAAG